MSRRRALLSPTFAFPMGAAILLAIIFLIYYFTWTARVERLLDGRAFRQLATASDQLQNRLNNYGGSLQQVSKVSEDREAYMRDHVPGLQWKRCSGSEEAAPMGASLRVENQQFHARFREEGVASVCATVPVEAAVMPFLQGTPEAFFDELLLADANGNVVFQTVKTGMRVASLGPLRRATQDSGKSKESGDGSQTSAAAIIPAEAAARSSTLAHDTLAGVAYRFYTVPVPLAVATGENAKAGRAHFFLAGLFEEDRFSREKLSVPGAVLIEVGLILAILIASAWPLLKLSTMRATELIPRRAGLYYSLLLLITSALAILLIVQIGYLVYQGETDRRLQNLAESMDRNLAAEAARAVGVIHGAMESRPFQEKSVRNALCAANPAPPWPGDQRRVLTLDGLHLGDYPYFHRLMWIDDKGTQRAKWEVGDKVTTRVSVADRPYVRETLQGNLWQLAQSSERSRFRIDPVYSRNTGEYLAVVAVTAQPKECEGQPIVAAMVTPFLSLIRPVLPPDFGFAVIDPDGKALFHSTAEKNGSENFLHETGNDGALRAAIFARRKTRLTASLYGADHRLFITPIDSVERCPWTLIVFRNLAPRRAQQLETLLLFCGLAVAYYLLLILVSTVVLRLPHYPSAWLWPQQSRSGEYVHLAITHAIAAAVLLPAIFAAAPAELIAAIVVIPAAGAVFSYWKLRSKEDKILVGAVTLWLAWLLVYLWNSATRSEPRWVVLALVTAALGAYVLLSNRGLTAKMARWGRFAFENTFAAAALTLILLVGILPCIGLFRLAHDHHAVMFARREQLLTLQALRDREERIKRENAGVLLTEEKAAQGLHDTVKWLFLRRRLEDARFDRYDRIDAVDERELAISGRREGLIATSLTRRTSTVPNRADTVDDQESAISHQREREERASDGRITRFLARLTSIIPNRGAEELRRMHVDSERESTWTWERTGDYLRLRERRENGGAGPGNSTLAALHKIAAGDAIYLSPELISGIGTIRLSGLPPGIVVPLVLLLAGIFFWIRSTARQLFLLRRRFGRPWEEFDPETTSRNRNLILVGLPCTGRTSELRRRDGIHWIDCVQGIQGGVLPREIPEQVVALDHFDCGTDPKAMKWKLETLEELILRRRKTVLIVTSVNPLFQLTGETDPERLSAGEPDSEADRWARVLMTFTPMRLRPAHVPSSPEYSRVLWSTCSRSERVALYQLAKGGWANYKNGAALEHLWQRGLIERTPVVRIADKGLRDFVAGFVTPDEWKAWHRKERAAVWDGLKLMFVVLILGIAATALFMNQQNVLAFIVTGISALTPLTRLLADFRISGKAEEQA